MTNLEGRIAQLEIAVKWLRDRLRASIDRTGSLRQNQQMQAGGAYAGGDTSTTAAGSSLYWARVGSAPIEAYSGPPAPTLPSGACEVFQGGPPGTSLGSQTVFNPSPQPIAPFDYFPVVKAGALYFNAAQSQTVGLINVTAAFGGGSPISGAPGLGYYTVYLVDSGGYRPLATAQAVLNPYPVALTSGWYTVVPAVDRSWCVTSPKPA